jgi:GH24 family phage-related lysozyme (muramidase)
MTAIEEAKKIWKEHAILREGKKNTVYRDTLGKPTVGIGHLVKPDDRLHVGDRISDIQVDIYFVQDTEDALKKALKQWKEINKLTPAFLAALISVNFQLGDFTQKFKNSYRLLVEHKFDQAISNIRASLWAKQTPVRVNDFVSAIESLK